MAKKRNKYDLQHDANVKKYQTRLDRIFYAALRECAAIGATISDFDPSKPFAFKDYPITRKRIRDLLNELADGVEAVVVNAVEQEWNLSNAKNDALVEQVLGMKAAELPAEIRRRYFSTNAEAEKAFLARKASGLNLSDRVWNYTNQFKEEIEMGLDLGIRDGLSADEMSRKLRKYLKEPNRLFRRVRDEHGNLHLSKAAKAYHPGRGVYRSSYKNARRLTATESNIAYRSADYERWQLLDFVVGIRVVLSNNHPVDDICNDLSAKQGSTAKTGRGCYPKDFKFTGWHPHCRCHVETILKTEEEMDRDTERIMNGEEPLETSENTVKDTPEAFDKWVKKNRDRIEIAKNPPYFIRDNRERIKNIWKQEKEKGKLGPIVDEIKAEGKIDHVPVMSYQEQPSEEQLIERIGGGDRTTGSCSSLAFAYAANKGGMVVLDFRGGQSTDYFSNESHICEIIGKVGGKTYRTENRKMSGMELMREAEIGKEYYLGIGRHAAIVRKNQNGRYEYLELQTETRNGWHELNAEVFANRFSAKGREGFYEMVDITKLYEDSSYKELMGYINTAEAKQKKGKGGMAK